MRFMAFKSVMAAVVLTTAGLGVQVAKSETALNVPFSFTVSGQTMPAGVYTVQQDTFHHAVILRNRDGSRSFAYALRPGDPASNEIHVSLRFETSGDTHILRWIQVGSKLTSRLEGRPATSFDPARLSQGR
jgi:hypothetical protein